MSSLCFLSAKVRPSHLLLELEDLGRPPGFEAVERLVVRGRRGRKTLLIWIRLRPGPVIRPAGGTGCSGGFARLRPRSPLRFLRFDMILAPSGVRIRRQSQTICKQSPCVSDFGRWRRVVKRHRGTEIQHSAHALQEGRPREQKRRVLAHRTNLRRAALFIPQNRTHWPYDRKLFGDFPRDRPIPRCLPGPPYPVAPSRNRSCGSTEGGAPRFWLRGPAPACRKPLGA